MNLSDRKKGVLLAVAGGSFWGGSGVAGQVLLQDCGFATGWLVTARMLLAGIILLAIDAAQHKGDIWSVWRGRQNVRDLLTFAWAGMLIVQYSYFACIAYGNAAAATVLQYLMPAFIVLYVALRNHQLPRPVELLCVLLAIGGTFLLVTHGEPGKLTIPLPALIWGIVSGLSGAVYTLTPKRLIRQWRATLIVGWGMLLGGLVLSFIAPPWAFQGSWTPLSLSVFLYVIIFGSVLAFWFYLGSTKYIQPGEAGVLASVEPLTAIILSVSLLGQPFGWLDFLGSACILLTVFILARQ
jgi:drug/metabolite transporter (DMT)-like permease